ncbi:replication initiation factor domain-containing protein [Neisseria gonorrhoeae]|uniref:replication initiation factor domain-containing protein n=1 Tax=Neisseria gonorrhoeae TaxID=485 RepID=UPI0009F3E11D|nr:replication initiation factor domain-containing protein [Neisseria gonorrhoeae]PNL75275.1 replication initiation factor [Neisseria gonorrhoeae]PNL75720.1 replication initiation factor [Neisseria gonorrhoeae]
MGDKQGMTKEVAGVMTEAPADGRKPATASNLPPPLSNRGGTETETAGRVQEVFECYETYITDGKGNLLGVPLRRGVSDSAFIDQITFSIHEDTFFHVYGLSFDLFDDDDFIRAASAKMEEIFGFGIIEKAKHSGGRFYEGCWLMGTENAQYGRVHFGGQQNTILFELTGTGCGVAKEGWESRLFVFLTNAIRPKITRVDIAKDFFNGEYSPNQAREDRNKGLFTCHHVKPKGECLGSDWEEEDEAKMTSGKTYGIGSRESSKYVRIYEKGKQLGDKTSTWTRFEIEFKAKDIVIPFEVLQTPGEYFGGAYPICERFTGSANRIEAVKSKIMIDFDTYIERLKKQIGRGINASKAVFPDKSKQELFEVLEPKHDFLPKKLSFENYDCSEAKLTPLHEIPSVLKFDQYGMWMDRYIQRQKRGEEQRYLEKMYDKYANLPISWA